ncbi:hypothetical protein BDE40_3035 [Litoreibacter halocynthiae]|uniref:Uncharacterized protein n=1 Tax=Litoreibacter halocynthiae TaxID=1242689 RepID=A0A4R7LF14_9RHOB|nr:hypothetical protein [Litoreibacter halocynthiae]TDT74247.1 hypothetical protein BDE40_3035 [Litoreibacter halocynthiae]
MDKKVIAARLRTDVFPIRENGIIHYAGFGRIGCPVRHLLAASLAGELGHDNVARKYLVRAVRDGGSIDVEAQLARKLKTLRMPR